MITLKELAAIVVRRGKLLVCLMVVFALLLGGWRSVDLFKDSNNPENSPEKIEERYQEALEDYENQKETLEKSLARVERKLNSQRNYNEESPLMELDPYNKAITIIYFAITDMEDSAFQQVFRTEETPVSFLTSKIQNQYLMLWNGLDLQAALQEDLKDQYLRELLTLSISEGGLMKITAYGATEQETTQLADQAYALLLAYKAVVMESSYVHNFSVLSETTKILVDQSLVDTQEANLEKVETYEVEVADLTQQLEALKAPVAEKALSTGEILKSSMKYLVLGAALGAVFALIWVMAAYLFRNRLELSRHLTEGLSVPLLGSLVKRKDLFARFADRILGERTWKSEEDALGYLAESAKAYLPAGGTVALLSTLELQEDVAQRVITTLQQQGFSVRFAGDVSRNAAVMSTVKESDCIVLLECCGASNWTALQEAAGLAKDLETPICGFVLV